MVVGVIAGTIFICVLAGAGLSPKATAVGYQPTQPVPFSHAVHAGKLGLDCRYCHTTVESAAFAALPATQTCMNCHTSILPGSEPLAPVRDSWQSGNPIEWVKVHNLPGYAYFNHAAHVTHGVSCVSCHGRIDRMDVVRQEQPLSMSWCLDCHREPEKHLRPKDQVTNLAWSPLDHPLARERGTTGLAEAQLLVGRAMKEQYQIRSVGYLTACSTCHR
ncbi:cytochrome c3 family protein [Humisphaera borealis]|uniref:cytochrome c3 family protein n=1 Tax=Humisphaera borealis TaxID=2807512 RepID=UPI0019D15F8A|nr:cytochrome c3 family protein [Humisphaera borealis]